MSLTRSRPRIPAHVRLAGLRLGALANEIRGALERWPEGNGCPAYASAEAVLAETGRPAQAALAAVPPAINLLAAAVLGANADVRPAQVERVMRHLGAATRSAIAHLHALRVRPLPAALEPQRRELTRVLTRPLAQMAVLFETMHSAMLHPDDFFARHPDGEVRMALELELCERLREAMTPGAP